MSTTELIRVAEIEFETSTWSNQELGNGFQGLALQPKGVRVDNGDCYPNWMSMHGTYTLAHDGTGWVVTSSLSENRHVRRLADSTGPRGSFVTALPVHGGGTEELIPGVTYQLAFKAADDGSRTALFLSKTS